MAEIMPQGMSCFSRIFVSEHGQVLALIWAPHLGQVMTIFPFPTGTRQMALQLLQVKYLWSLSAWRARAPALLFFTLHHQFTHRWFSSRRL